MTQKSHGPARPGEADEAMRQQAERSGWALRIPRWLADVAPDQAAVTEAVQQVAGDRGGRALALGAGDEQHAGGIGFLQPQAQAAGHRHAPLFQPHHLRAVAADPRGLDDHIALLQRGEPAVAGREYGHPDDRDGLRPVIDQYGLYPHRAELADVRQALTAEAPHPDTGARQI